jgi:Ca-activated chloride channel homolog
MIALSFAYPWMLLGLLAPLALIAWVWTRSSGRVALPYDHAQAHRSPFVRILIQSAESLPAFGLATALILLAGPQKLGKPKTKRSLTNIEFCIDISGSMVASFGEGTRYDAAMQSINDFLDYRTGDAFGLTFFGQNVMHWVPLTTDTSAFRCAPPFMDPKRGNTPTWFMGTSIGKALLACGEVLSERKEGDRMIILISDGYSSDLGNGQDEVIAKKLREDGIAVYGVHVADGAIPGQVVNIASITGGDMFEAGDPVALSTVFRRIDEMRATKLEKVAAERLDDFALWSWAGLTILAMHVMLQFFLRYTPW